VLGEAMLLDNQLSLQSPRAQVVRAELVYRHAIEIDPWNPMGHVSFARFMLRHASSLGAQTDDRAIEQLRAALQLAPSDVDASAELFALYRRRGEIDQALDLAAAMLNWCERIRRRGVAEDHLLFKEIAAVAVAAQNEELAVSLQACRNQSYPASASGREPTWMMRWLRSFSHPGS
jgi:tetratricopeptide (TPR) repeat protein